MHWKNAELGPWLHGALVWLATDGSEIVIYITNYATGHQTDWNWQFFIMGLIAAIGTAILSAGRNKGAVMLPTVAGDTVKAIQAGDPTAAVVVPAHQVVATNESVIVLRGQSQ